MRRVVVPALAAIVVVAVVAVGVWMAIARTIAASVVAQARVAHDLLEAGAPLDQALSFTLRRPGLHVVMIDLDAGTLIDASASGMAVHPFPPGPSGAPPPGAPPPPEGTPPGRPPRLGPFARAALAFVHQPAIVARHGDRSISVGIDVDEVSYWFALDIVSLIAAWLVVVAFALARIAAIGRAAQRALERRAMEREAAAQRYQRFLAETGHELRTPLTVMAGYVDILRTRNANEPLDRRILEGMFAETSRMRVLVEKMMTLARLDSLVTVPCMLDVATATREAVQTVLRRYPGRNVRVDVDGAASIIIDADDFGAALGNLLENAVKHAPDSPILVTSRGDDGYAVVSVIDAGTGIAAADRQSVFEPFFRGSTRASTEGLGLGLAIVKRVADRWDGTVECTSGDGRTAFTLRFPLADEERDAVVR
jgi:signal transduction histidine kinase